MSGERLIRRAGKRPIHYDFSGLGEHTFTEELDNGTITEYHTETDSRERITKITGSDIKDVTVLWKSITPSGTFRFCARKPPNQISRWQFADILFTGTVVWEGSSAISYENADETQLTHLFPLNRDSFMRYQWVTMEGIFEELSLHRNNVLYNINSLPASLKYRTDFTDMFASCIYLAILPSNLFENCESAKKMIRTFIGCPSITSIPSGLFTPCPNIDDFTNCFLGCTALTGNAPALWELYPNAIGTGCFKNCTRLSNYADIPDSWK